MFSRQNTDSNLKRKSTNYFQQSEFKRRRNEYEDESEINTNRRFSANDRLHKYREVLKKTSEPVRMHEVFYHKVPEVVHHKPPVSDTNDNAQPKAHYQKLATPSSLQNRLQQIRNNKSTNPKKPVAQDFWNMDSNNLNNRTVKILNQTKISWEGRPFNSIDTTKPTVDDRVNSLKNNILNSINQSKIDMKLKEDVIIKPLSASNLPKSEINYKVKCENYLKSNYSSYKLPELPSTRISPPKSISSDDSMCSVEKRNGSIKEKDDENDNLKFPREPLTYNYYNSDFAANNKLETESADLAMEWIPFDEKVIISNIQELRAVASPDILPKSEFQESVQKIAQEFERNNNVLKTLYVVVDTNIFLAHLKIVQQIMDVKINGVETPVILIPWIVIQELDYIKDGRNKTDILKEKAQVSIKFINNALKTKQVQGQSVNDALKQKFSSTSGDDGVLSCCLQILENNHRAILLSNDINLRNKALMNNIPAYAHNEILNILNPYQRTTQELAKEEERINKLEEIKVNVSHLVSLIIIKEMKDAYGPVWNKMDMMNKPPWTLEDCLVRLLKYWGAVFSFSLQKTAKQKFEEFQNFLSSENNITVNPNDFIEYCLALCLYLKNGFHNYRESINDCVEVIERIRSSL